MNKKFINLVESGNFDALEEFIRHLSAEETIEVEEELLKPEHFKPEVVRLYVRYFGFTEEREILFLQMAPADLRRFYINLDGLHYSTQQYVIDNKLVEIARDLSKIKTFKDVDYLLEHGLPIMIEDFLRYHMLQDNEQVLTLAKREYKTLFRSYVSREGGCFISEDVISKIIDKGLDAAFNALVWQYGRNFKEKARHNTLAEILAMNLDDMVLPEQFQIKALKSRNLWLAEPLLKTTPLYPGAQKVLFDMHYDMQWLKVHFVNMYGVGGYRFEPQYEEMLFAALDKKNLDECLLEFKERDDVVFVKNATQEALLSYTKTHRFSDEGQVALLERQLLNVARVFISGFTPEHGMCGQAEVKLVELYPSEVINLYTAFHSMCDEAVCLLKQKSEEGIAFYYQNHAVS